MTATRPPFWQAFADAEELLDRKRAERAVAAPPPQPGPSRPEPFLAMLRLLAGWRR